MPISSAVTAVDLLHLLMESTYESDVCVHRGKVPLPTSTRKDLQLPHGFCAFFARCSSLCVFMTDASSSEQEQLASSPSNECVIGEFDPGPGVLVLGQDRFAFVGSPELLVEHVSRALRGPNSAREFFMDAASAWLDAGTNRPDLIVGVIGLGSVSVMAFGRTSVDVRTDAESDRVDPTVATFVAERTFRGRLKEISVGDIGSSVFRSIGGVLPVRAFRLLSDSVAVGRVALMGSGTSDPAVTEAPSPAEVSESAGVVDPEIAPMLRPVPAPDPRSVSPDSDPPAFVALVNAPSCVPTQVTGSSGHNALVDDLEDSDGMTVWPMKGLVKVAESATEAWPDSEIETQPLQQPTSRFPEIAPEHDLRTESVPVSEKGLSDNSSLPVLAAWPESVIDQWVPPAPVSTVTLTAAFAAGTDDTLSPAAWTGAPNRVASPKLSEPDDETELTMLPKDVERFRQALVQRIDPVAAPQNGDVLGASCTNGHFTDSRKVRCLFCDAETDFAQVSTGPRPALGSLTFDDGRTLELTRNVLVGRKPAFSNGQEGETVGFNDDLMLSRVHVEVRLVDWDVVIVDHRSGNGTKIVQPDGRELVARPLIETVIFSGTVVRFGRHSFDYRVAARG